MKHVLGLLAIALLAFLILPIEFNIKYAYINGCSDLRIYINYLLGLLKFKIYPIHGRVRGKINTVEYDNLNLKDGIGSFRQAKEYKRFVNFIWNRSVIKGINWESRIGFEDAYITGTIVGLLWSLKGIIIGFLLGNKKIEELSFSVMPVFNTNHLYTSFNCIIRMKMVYIISVWIWLLGADKGGEKIARTSN